MSHVAAKESGRVWRRVKRAMLHLAIMVAASVGFLVGHDLGVSGNESLAQDKPAPEVHDVITAHLIHLDYRGRNAAVLRMMHNERGATFGLDGLRGRTATSLGVSPDGNSQLTVYDATLTARFIVCAEAPIGRSRFALNYTEGYIVADYGEKALGELPYIRFESEQSAPEVAFWEGDLVLRSNKWRSGPRDNHIEVIPDLDSDGKPVLRTRPFR